MRCLKGLQTSAQELIAGERGTESEGWEWKKIRIRLSLWISAVCTVADMAYCLSF